MITKIVFILFLYIAAWQDYKTGEVDLSLLLTSFVVTLAINILGALSDKSLSFELPGEQAVVFLIVLATFLLSVYFKKMGAADVVIFMHILILFGVDALFKIMLLASTAGIVLTTAVQLKNKSKLKWADIRKYEIRFIPLIYPRAKTFSCLFQSFRSRATLVGAKSEFLFALSIAFASQIVLSEGFLI